MAIKLREPAEKLSLTVRKNLRDNWEPKKAEFETEISEILNETWSIELDVLLIYSYAESDYNSRLGDVIVWYIEPFVHNLKKFVEQHGEDGKKELNSACSEHKLVFGPQETTDFNYGGLVIKDRKLHLVFADGAFPSNVDEVSKDFAGAIATAAKATDGSSTFNIIARGSVKKEYDPKIEEVHEKVKKILNMPDIRLNPHFEANADVLANANAEDWAERIGYVTLSYFEGFVYALERNKFDGDDMLQEGFAESVDKKEVCIRLFQKWADGEHRYNEGVIEDGVLYIQTVVDYWGSNVDDAAIKILDIL